METTAVRPAAVRGDAHLPVRAGGGGQGCFRRFAVRRRHPPWQWELDSDGVLTISPAPAIVTKPLLMIDFASGDSPWYGYADQIKSVAFAHTGSGFVFSIGKHAFHGCINLTEITLPGSLTAIEKVAFLNCTNLASITFTGDTPPIISWDEFTDCGITEIRVPAGAEDAYREMLSKAGLDRIEVKGGYSITVTATEGGTASASSDFAAEGEEVALTAVPDRGYRLKEWQVVSGGVTVDSGRFVMPAGAVTVKAVFEKEDEPPSHTHAWAGLEPEQHPPLARVPHGGLYNPIGQRKERLRRPHPRRMDCGPGGHQLRGGQ